MQSKMFLAACSLLFSGCGIPRPNANLCIYSDVDKAKYCLNMLADYNDDGTVKAGATPKKIPILSLKDLDSNLTVDPDGQVELKVWAAALRAKRVGH